MAEPPGETSPVVVLCRDAWRAKAPKKGLVEHSIRSITIHHTATVFKDNRRGPRALRSIQSYHQRHPRKPLPDIAYHYIIDRNGMVYEGRATTYRGDTHTNYDPTGHLLICLLGNFQEQTPSDAQLDTLADLVSWAIKRYELSTDRIGSHRDHAATACPGKVLHEELKSGRLLKRIHERRAASNASLLRVCGRDATALIEQVESSKRFGRRDSFETLKVLTTMPP